MSHDGWCHMILAEVWYCGSQISAVIGGMAAGRGKGILFAGAGVVGIQSRVTESSARRLFYHRVITAALRLLLGLAVLWSINEFRLHCALETGKVAKEFPEGK